MSSYQYDLTLSALISSHIIAGGLKVHTRNVFNSSALHSVFGCQTWQARSSPVCSAGSTEGTLCVCDSSERVLGQAKRLAEA
jgi:hypothetical protein